MKPWTLLIISLLWLVTVGAGTGLLLVYDYTPGKTTSIPTAWPPLSKISHVPDKPTLVMFAHPDCPCTRASIGNLAVLMTHCQNRLTAHVVFLRPEGTEEKWSQTDLWRSAEAIPGVFVQSDEEGKEAQYFKATTSGQVVLYDAEGRLLFSGGITPSRGHYGDNVGLSAIQTLVNYGTTLMPETPVFGCSLLDPPSNVKASSWTR